MSFHDEPFRAMYHTSFGLYDDQNYLEKSAEPLGNLDDEITEGRREVGKNIFLDRGMKFHRNFYAAKNFKKQPKKNR